MPDASEVVVVGGGIGGASLAYALARAGVGVTVLEASTEFADRVRGESMQAWGLKEARELGVEHVLLDAGAHITPVWKQYMEGTSDVEFTFKPQGDQTNVTWAMSGRHTFISKAICLFMNQDKMLGGYFEKGLASLKTVVEGPRKT